MKAQLSFKNSSCASTPKKTATQERMRRACCCLLWVLPRVVPLLSNRNGTRPYWATSSPPSGWFNDSSVALPAVNRTASMKALFPRVLLLDASVLRWNRLSEEWLGPAWELRKAADVALRSEPVSVVANAALKKNAHEYHSVGPYWWPDPGKPPEGLPYVWKPGQVNPDRKNRGDYLNLKNVVCSVSRRSRWPIGSLGTRLMPCTQRL